VITQLMSQLLEWLFVWS